MKLNWDKLPDLNGIESAHTKVVQKQLLAAMSQSGGENLDVYNRLEDLLTSVNTESYDWGDDIASIFSELRQSTKTPDIPFLLRLLCDFFDIEDDHNLLPFAMMATLLAMVDNENPYHNNHHFFEVICMVIKLCIIHNALEGDQELSLSNDDILILFISACIHDFDHKGKGNLIDGKHFPSLVEMRSCAHAKPFFIHVGMPEKEFDKIESLIICTDVSRGDFGSSPAKQARDIFLSHAHENVKVSNLNYLYKTLIDDKKMSLMALLLAEADIAMSSALTYEFSKDMTRLVASESQVLRPSAKTLYGFMEVICHGGFLSRAANLVFGQNFQAILLEAQADSEKDVLYS